MTSLSRNFSDSLSTRYVTLNKGHATFFSMKHSLLVLLLTAIACSGSDSNDSPQQTKATEVASDWEIYRGNPSLHGVAPGSLQGQPALAWTFQTEGAIVSSPVVSKGLTFFGSSDGSLYAVELETGKKRWSFATDDIIDAPPLVHDGRVFFGSADFFFHALDAETGKSIWKYETEDKILGGANWARGADGKTRILVGSYDTHLYCFSPEDGELLWKYETENYVNGTPAILGDHVIFGGCDAVLHIISITTGEKVAEVDLGTDCHVAGSVALADGKAYFGHYGNAFICIDLESGQLLWDHQDPQYAFFSSPAIAPNRIVFGGRNKHLTCVDKATGELLWTFKTKRKVDASPVICGDRVICGSGDGRLYILDLDDGTEVWNYEIGQAIFSSPAVAAGMILVGSNDKRLYAFRSNPDKEGR